MSKPSFISGNYSRQLEYKSFSPNPINVPFSWNNKKVSVLLEEANLYLGELSAFSKLIPDIDYFIQMHVAKEATQSSRIEGTKTNLEEALSPKEQIAAEKRDDWQEVQNYISSMNWAIDQLEKLPLSVRLLKNTHKRLLTGVRGAHKHPGEIRASQNWIGGSSLKDAYFIPPHHGELPTLLSDLESYWHNKKLQVPHLIKIAISHYQFETIHPFLDGNGRIGRLLITLYLVSSGILPKPTLYLSDFLEKNRGSYYDSLTTVRASNDIDQWLVFFLNGVIQTSKKSKDTLETIIGLRKQYKLTIAQKISPRRQKLAQELLTKLYSKPQVNVNTISSMLGVAFPTANNLAEELVVSNMFKEKTKKERDRVFSLWEYIDVFQSK